MKIICKIENGLCVIAGLVTNTKDEGERYTIRVRYDEGTGKTLKTVETDVVFLNQKTPTNTSDHASVKPKLYAKWAREKNAQPGDRIIIFARFPSASDIRFANGYSCKLNGVITVGRTTEKEETNVVSGLVDRVAHVRSEKGAFLILHVYLGVDPFTGAKRTMIYVFEKFLINRCLRDLQPKPDGTKVYAAFLCGQSFPYIDYDGRPHDVFRGFDFTVMGERAS